MNIAVITRATIDHFTSGGMETQLQNLVEGLAESGHKVVVITTSHPYNKDPFIETEDLVINRNDVEYFFIGDTTPGLSPLNLWEKLFSLLGLLKRGVKKEGKKNFYKESKHVYERLNREYAFDIVISQSTFAYGIVDLINVPLISIIHGSIKAEIRNRYKTNQTLFNWGRYIGVDLPTWLIELYTVNKTFNRKVSKIVAVSKAVEAEFADDHPEFKEKVDVIYNGVDSELFKPDHNKRTEFITLYVGRMVREKGIDISINAIKLLLDKGIDIKMNLVGTGEHLSELRALAVNLGLSNNINFIGDIPNEKLSDYYQSASVFLLPTRRVEGHPMTISEAYCSGLPVIATKKGGLKELVFNHETGYIVKEDDSKDLADKIKKLYDNEPIVERLSENVRKIAIAKYSKKAMIEKYNKLIHQVVDEDTGLNNNS